MKESILYIHGKGGAAEEAEHYKPLFPDCEVIGFDYRSRTPWEAREEFPVFFAGQRQGCDRLTLIANSIGAFFTMSALDETLADRACFISPVVDMESLIGNMMQWANVTEQVSRSWPKGERSPRTSEKHCPGAICAMCGNTRSHGMFRRGFCTASTTI